MGYYKELDIERLHHEETEALLLASMQPLLSDKLIVTEDLSILEAASILPIKSESQSNQFYQ